MGMILNAAKSIGKEFLANKAADILGGSDKATPTETAQNDIPVDLSETTSMEDTYEPTVSDADENDPGIVEPENYELQPLEDLEDNPAKPGSSFLSVDDFFNFVDSDTPKGNHINVDNSEEESFEDFVNRQEQEEASKASNTESLADISPRESLENVAEIVKRARDENLDEGTIENIYNQGIEALESAGYFDKLRESTDEHKRELFRDDFDALYKALMHKAKWTTNKSNLESSKYKELSAAELEQVTEEHPEKVQEDLPNTPIAEEAAQITDDNDKRNDEVNNDAAEETVELLDDMPLVSGYRREGDKLLDEYGNEIPDYEPIDTEDGVLKEKDEDFLGQDEWVDEEGNIHDYSELANGNAEALDKKWYEGDESGEGEYSESGNVNLDYETADLQNQIEEAKALPVTNAEEAKEKQNRLRALRLKLKEVQTATGSGSNVPSAGPTTDNGTQTTGGRVSPRAGIGSIGGGAAGHGSMASTSPTKVVDNHNSIASKAPLPQALEDNQGRVVSVNGKATTAPSSNNNGAFRSGSFGLMSKAKSNLKSIPSKAPVSGGPEHMGGNTDMSNDLNLEDGKQILIERLKQLLAQLTDEEKKQMGFSAALNQWNGKALSKLDGYTLQDLIDKVEEYLGGK